MRATRAIALASATAIALAACGSDSSTEGTDGDSSCPTELVIQTDWFPELEHGGTYQLIGPDGVADKDTVSYSGPIQEQYAVGGLEEIEIKTVSFDKANETITVRNANEVTDEILRLDELHHAHGSDDLKARYLP